MLTAAAYHTPSSALSLTVKWVLTSCSPAMGEPRIKSSQSPGIRAFELHSGNFHLAHAALVPTWHRQVRGCPWHSRAPWVSQAVCSPARLQLAQVPDHVVPFPDVLPLLTALQVRSSLSFRPYLPSFPAHLLLGCFLATCLLVVCASGNLSVLPQLCPVLYLLNSINFSEGSGLVFPVQRKHPCSTLHVVFGKYPWMPPSLLS